MSEENVEQGYQAQTRIDTFQGKKAVIKQVKHPRIPLLRDIEFWLLKREARSLETLQDVSYVPDFLGYPDRYSIAMEFREGKLLSEFTQEDIPDDLHEDLNEAIREMHVNGIVHADLMKKENIIVDPEGKPVLIDFGTSLRQKSSLHCLNNFLFDQFKEIDLNVVPKLKRRHWPDKMSQEDHKRLQDRPLLEQLSYLGRKYILFKES